MFVTFYGLKPIFFAKIRITKQLLTIKNNGNMVLFNIQLENAIFSFVFTIKNRFKIQNEAFRFKKLWQL